MRVSGIFVISPIFGNENMPMTTRVGFVTLISLILLPVVGGTAMIEVTSMGIFVYYAVQELMIGIAIGFAGAVYFSVSFLAGTMLDRQTGLALANAVDPLSDSEIPILGSFYNILFVFLFLSINGHHMFIRALSDSYQLLPVGHTIVLSDETLLLVISYFRDLMILAFILSAPVVVTSFLANVVLGIFAKTMPQINVFVVGMPLRIVVGMLTIWVTVQAVIPFSEGLFDRMFKGIYQLMRLLS
jgi:flagellar biosynthesis protein FliR